MSDTHSRRKRRDLWAVLILVAVLAVPVWQQWRAVRYGDAPAVPRATEKRVYEFAVFNTYGRLTLWADPAVADDAAAAVRARLEALHAAINVFDPDSELSRLNRTAAAAPFACSPELWRIVVAGRQAYALTEGAFDVTVGPLMRLWGFHAKRDRWPSQADIDETLQRVGFDKVVLDDQARTVAFARPGMMLDFGGIAKGYGLDLAVDEVLAAGIRRGLVDLGGNVFCLPEPPPGRASYIIGVRNPFNTFELVGRVEVLGAALATSGNYERSLEIDGRRVPHIIDPATGHPVATLSGVTIITPRGVESDVFSTAVFVGGVPLIERLRNLRPQTTCITVAGDARNPILESYGPVRLLE